MERYQPDQYGRMMPDAHGQWVSLRAAELTALDAAQKSSADAQATIAALQARVQELEEITKVICGHCCEPMEIPSKAVLQSQLAQRTAELEAAKQQHGQSENAAQLYYRELTRAKNRICEAAGLPPDSGYEPAIKHLQAELERVSLLSSHNERRFEMLEKKYKELRTLIAALPKVEGAVVVSNGYVKDSTRCHALFGADEDAALYAALLQHRQGMEG